MRLATGDCVSFLDADDVWFKNFLQTHAGFIRKYPEVGFFTGNYIERDRSQGFRMTRHFERATLPSRRASALR